MKKIDISGMWKMDSGDLIELPGTLSYRKATAKSDKKEYKNLTDPYAFEGEVFFSKRIRLPKESYKKIFLNLERTRISKVYADNKEISTCESFVAPHVYDLTEAVNGKESFELTISVKNTDYKTGGGHMTSKDTQTNWLGILGEMSIYLCDGVYIEKLSARSDLKAKAADISMLVFSDEDRVQTLTLSSRVLRLKEQFCKHDTDISYLKSKAYEAPEKTTDAGMIEDITDTLKSKAGDFTHTFELKAGLNLLEIQFMLGDEPYLWSDEKPYVYEITADLAGSDSDSILFGLREFKTENMHFTINGKPVLLRGKHDGMIFPITGFAPMNVYGWLYVMKQARDLGINHYRFHTCTPPEAAFIAADLLGIFMEPEIPFWGTFLGKDDEGYEEAGEAQEFLKGEGFNMLSCFSSHPSYCMMSMGNELWGNPAAIDDMISGYKEKYPDVLFTQSSNGFQWTPNIQAHDDFFCGVRFAKDRQLRGSYAACDKPYGHVQIAPPGTRYDYEKAIFPDTSGSEGEDDGEEYVEIQYGTGVKRVKKTDALETLIPKIPVVSHEIGQYTTYPKLSEREKYTGVMKACYLDIIEEKLKEKKLDEYASDYFRASGALAVSCYKEELEGVYRTPSMAGFQLLDIQDFPGQDIALVGVLDALMENKGLITARDFRRFCSDAVILAEFDSYVLADRPEFDAVLSYYRSEPIRGREVSFELYLDDDLSSRKLIASEKVKLSEEVHRGNNALGHFSFELPSGEGQFSYLLKLSVSDTDIENEYRLWSYRVSSERPSSLFKENAGRTAYSFEEAREKAKENNTVILFLSGEENKKGIRQTYSTDFWCYPMFKSISESMGKEIPEGTMGLLIRKEHHALASFLTEYYTTPQWYEMVTEGAAVVLDDTDIVPVVEVIDNFDRAHRLGFIFEFSDRESKARIIVCAADLRALAKDNVGAAYYLAKSLYEYADSEPSGKLCEAGIGEGMIV